MADSEREEPSIEYMKESSGSRTHNKIIRGNFRKKTGEKESTLKVYNDNLLINLLDSVKYKNVNCTQNNKLHKGNYRDESQPGYDAWRAERNRIDEDRSYQQTKNC